MRLARRSHNLTIASHDTFFLTNSGVRLISAPNCETMIDLFADLPASAFTASSERTGHEANRSPIDVPGWWWPDSANQVG